MYRSLTSLARWFRSPPSLRRTRPSSGRRRAWPARPALEPLETRLTPSTFAVTSTQDNTSTGTLRWAVSQANSTPGNNTIDFEGSLWTTPQTITIKNGQLTLTNLTGTSQTTTIQGPGAALLTVSGSFGRVFNVLDLATVTVSGLTISNGNVNYVSGQAGTGSGGAITSRGTLTVNNCTFSNNSANGSAGYGGAIASVGQLTLSGCTFSGNTAGTAGGAVYEYENLNFVTTVTGCAFSNNTSGNWGGAVYNDGLLTVSGCTFTSNTTPTAGGAIFTDIHSNTTVTGSTFTGNSTTSTVNANSGGAISNNGTMALAGCTLNGNVGGGGGAISNFGPLTVTSCTLSGNTANGSTGNSGGGIYTDHPLTVICSTISGNSAGYGGGIYNNPSANAAVTLSSSIVAANTASSSGPDINGPMQSSSSYDLIGNGSAMFGISSGTNNNQVGTAASPINPLLSPLGSYGGTTQTMALLPGSPALGAGNPNAKDPGGNAITTDQRGVARTVNGRTDAGAFESQGFTLTRVSGDGQTALVATAFTNPLVVQVAPAAAGEPVSGGTVAFTGPASGAGLSPAAATVVIDANGRASLTATANTTTGSYQVTASTAAAAGPVTFNLVNTGVIDNGQAGFSETGTGWTHYTGAGYNNNLDYAAAGTGANTASWQLTGLPAGNYDAEVTWNVVSNHATNATYSVYDGNTLLANVTVNQQQAPSGTTVNGSVFQSLGHFQVSSGTLKVVLSDNANGYVIADAAYFTAVPAAPQAQVAAGSQAVAYNGSFAMSALVGQAASQTFTVTNTGGATLTLADPITLPSGFTLTSDFGSTSLAPGQSTSFTVQLNTSSSASYSGAASFGTNVSGANPFSFTLSGTVASSTVIDNGQAGFSETGSGWTHYTGAGYGNNLDYAAAGTGSNTATWQLTGLAAGNYDAQVTWTAVFNHATNATYSVYDGSTLLGTVTVNQQQAPSGTTVNGSIFQSLGHFQVNSGTLKVVLSDNANGYVVADAARVVTLPAAPQVQVSAGSQVIADGGSFSMSALVGQSAAQTFTVTNTGGATLTLSDPITLPSGFTLSSDFGSTSLAPGQSTTFVVQMNTASAASYSGTASFGTNDANNNPFSFTLAGTVVTSTIIDNGQAGFSETGSGWTHYTGTGYGNNLDYAAAGSGANTATWQLTGLASGTYDAQMTWNVVSNHATNATYSVYDGNTLLGTVTVNQQQTPSGATVNGTPFQSLGHFTIASGTLKVVLTDNANGYVIADAFRAVVS